jgi:hypothetical protein
MMYRFALFCATAAFVVKRADGQACTSHAHCETLHPEYCSREQGSVYPCYCKVEATNGETRLGVSGCEACIQRLSKILERDPLLDTFAPIDGSMPDACKDNEELQGEVDGCELETMRCVTDPECMETIRAPDSCGEDFECDGDEEFDLDRCCGEDICEDINECYVSNIDDDDDDDDDDDNIGIGVTSCYTGMFIAIAIVAALLIVVGIVLVVFCCCCRNKNKPAVVQQQQQQQPQMMLQQQPMMVQQPMVVSA